MQNEKKTIFSNYLRGAIGSISANTGCKIAIQNRPYKWPECKIDIQNREIIINFLRMQNIFINEIHISITGNNRVSEVKKHCLSAVKISNNKYTSVLLWLATDAGRILLWFYVFLKIFEYLNTCFYEYFWHLIITYYNALY